MRTPHYARLALLSATFIWGTTFLITQNTLEAIDTYYLLALRFTGAALLLTLLFPRRFIGLDATLLRRGNCLGLILFIAYVLQTEALKRTSPGKVAFFSAVDCIAVPFLAWLFGERRPTLMHLSAACFCLVGIGCVSLEGKIGIGAGELLALACGILFGAHIWGLSRLTAHHPILPITVIQFATTASLAWLFALLFNRTPKMISAETCVSLIYLCIFATALAFLLQTAGQQKMPPSSAAMILSLEAVFGVVFAMIFANEPVTPMVGLGFALIFSAILIAELHTEHDQK